MPKALSLKYRPKTFSDLVGQESVSQTLSLALSLDKVSHAYLFSGLRGSGKTSSARIFARALQCEKFPTDEPCNECDSCKSALNGSHLDIIEMDAASSRGIDDIKSLIEQIAYPPSFGRFKIFIIDEIHMLTKEAFNAFLKTLEEPPNYVKFILATTDPLKLPVTILSRTQHFRFKKIAPNNIEAHLKKILALENVAFEDKAINLLSRNCGGSLRDAMTMLEQAIIFSKENITLQSLSTMLGSLNPTKINDFFEAILARDDGRIDSLLSEFEAYEAENVLNEMIDFLKGKMLEKDSKYGLVVLERFFKILGESKNMLNINADSGFVLLLAMLKMKESLKIQDIDRVIAKMEREILSEAGDLKSVEVAESNAKSNATKSVEAIESRKDSNKDSSESKADSGESTANHLKQDSVDLGDSNSDNPSLKFKNLISKIYERDYELGEIFSKNISFVSLENGILTWESRADNATKAKLKPYFKLIQEILKEIFGDVKIQNKSANPTQNVSDSSKSANLVQNVSDSSELRKTIKEIFTIENEERV